RTVDTRLIPAATYLFEPGHLPVGRGFVDVENLDRWLIGRDEVVDAHDHPLTPFDGLLEPVGALCDLALRESLLHCGHHPAHAVDAGEVVACALHEVACQ